jgi:hypothetical protein
MVPPWYLHSGWRAQLRRTFHVQSAQHGQEAHCHIVTYKMRGLIRSRRLGKGSVHTEEPSRNKTESRIRYFDIETAIAAPLVDENLLVPTSCTRHTLGGASFSTLVTCSLGSEIAVQIPVGDHNILVRGWRVTRWRGFECTRYHMGGFSDRGERGESLSRKQDNILRNTTINATCYIARQHEGQLPVVGRSASSARCRRVLTILWPSKI